jgi:membrane fusion protein (multidrug efflux system)
MLALVLAFPTLLIAGCNDGKKPAKARNRPPPLVKTAKAEVLTLADRLELTGAIEPTRIARMASPVEGPVIACPVREGDRVRPGQLLARLGRAKGDDATAVFAQAELERDELELGRIEKLVKTGALPGEDLDKARVKMSEARARLAHATERLTDYRIVAPWSGIVSKVHVAVGYFVSARASLVELFDPDSLVLRFAVPEQKAALVLDTAAITVTLDAHPGQAFTGAVTRVYPEIDRRTHTRIVEGTIAGDVVLVPGMFARLEVTLSSVPEAVAVPRESVLRQGDTETVVFVIKPGGLVERRLVKTGIEDAGRVQIVAGVKPGEQVAVAGHARLRDGMKVRLTNERIGKRKDKRNKDPRPADAPDPGASP